MKADLHIHTYYSDGKYSPDEIATRAKEAGVELLSMTDHDSLEGLSEKRAAAERAGLKFVSGWEVSSYDGVLGKVHVLGYNCNTEGAYQAFLQERKRGALLRAEDTVQKANAYFGLRLTVEDADRERVKKESPLHTMHVVRAYARVLNTGKDALKMGLGELYCNYFAKGKPAYSDLCRPTPYDALEVIRASGGVAVLAHPGRIEGDAAAVESLLNGLCAAGLGGIECVYITHTPEQTAYFRAYARKHGLLVTGGSDFHAENGRRFLGKPDFYADGRLLDALGIT